MKLIPEAFLFILSIAQGVSVLPGMQEGAGNPAGSGKEDEDDVLLDSEWTIWHERVKVEQGGLTETDYMKELTNMGAFQSLKEFWELWGTISFDSAGTVHIFKTGIKPIWEDPANQDGGKWVVTVNQEHEDHQRVMKMWFSLVVAVFCRQLEYSTDMCGIVLAVRNWGTGLHVWNMHAGDTEKQEVVKQSLHKLLKTKKIKYIRHQTSILKNMNTSDSEGSKPKNWGDKKRVFHYDSEHKSRPAPSAQEMGARGRRFSVGSESKPELENVIAPPRPSFAAPAKNPWNAPKFGATMEPVAEAGETHAPAPAPVQAAPVPHKNPWNIPPKTAAPAAVPEAESTPAPTPTPAPPTPSPAVAPTSLSDSTDSSGENKSYAPTNPWKKLPKQNMPDFSLPKKSEQKEQPKEEEIKEKPKDKVKNQKDKSKQSEPKQPKQPKSQPEQTQPEPTKTTNKQNDDFKFAKPAPVPPKEKPASMWDGKKVIKTLETADKTDFMPIEPTKPEKNFNKALQAKKRNYTTDPSSGEEDNSRRIAPFRPQPPQPLPQNITAAPVFSAPAPSHPDPSTTAAPSSTPASTSSTPATNSEWSVIADKPKRKPRTGPQDNNNTQSDREAYTRPRNQQQYELLEGIQEEEEERAERERKERAQRATQKSQLARSETAAQQEEVAEAATQETKEEGKEEENYSSPEENKDAIPFVPPPSTPTIASLIAANASAEANPSPKPTPTRRKRELGVRHNESKSEKREREKQSHAQSAEAAAAQAARENLKVLIVAPCAMLAILLMVYFLFL